MADAGSLLVRAGLIRPEALEAARRAQRGAGGTLSEQLVLAGALDDESLTQFYRQRLLVPRIADARLQSVSEKVVGTIPGDLAAELRVVPVSIDSEGNLTVAMSDPSDTHAVDEIGFFTGHYVVRAVASQRQIAWSLAHYYGVVTELGRTLLGKQIEAVAGTAGRESEAARPDGPRPRSITAEVEASRHPVVAPESRSEKAGSDAAMEPLDEWADALRKARRAGTIRDPVIDEDDDFDEIGDYDEVDDLGEVPLARAREISRAGSFEAAPGAVTIRETESGGVAIADEAWELEAELPEIGAEEMAPDESGSPPELAPRAGELEVPRAREPSVGGATPRVVLDEELLYGDEVMDGDGDDTVVELEAGALPDETVIEVSSEPTAVDVEIEIELDSDTYGLAGPEPQLASGSLGEAPASGAAATPETETETEAEGEGEAEAEIGATTDVDVVPAPAVRSEQRGTDSAPILLGDIGGAIGAAERAEENVDDAAKGEAEVDDSSTVLEPARSPDTAAEEIVVLLERPKNRRTGRSTAVGLGAPPPGRTVRRHVTTGRGDEMGEPGDTIPVPGREAAPMAIDFGDSGQMRSLMDAVVSDFETQHRVPTAPPELDDAGAARLLDALEDLQRVADRDGIVAILLDYLDDYCERVVFLALRSGYLEPWQVRTALPAERMTPGRLALREMSILRDIVDTRLPYRGPITDRPSRTLIESVFGSVEDDGLALPVAVRGRVVGLLFADRIGDSLKNDNVALVTQAAGRALERMLKQKR
jgi:hypothetical protein